jgi:hypothetical protein
VNVYDSVILVKSSVPLGAGADSATAPVTSDFTPA